MNSKDCIIEKYNTVYSYNVYVVLNPDKDILDKRFKLDGSTITDESSSSDTRVAYTVCNATDLEDDRYCFVVVLNGWADDLDLINTCAHEANHVTMNLLSEVGITYSDDSEEAFAYLTGYIAECIYKTVRGHE